MDNKVSSICCECFLAYAEPDKPLLSAGAEPVSNGLVVIDHCRCGGLLVRPEIEMAANLHYAMTAKASRTYDNKMMGTMQ